MQNVGKRCYRRVFVTILITTDIIYHSYTDMCKMDRAGVELIWSIFNTLRPRQNGRHFPDDTFKCIFLNENVWIVIKFSLKFVPKCSINNIPALVQIMAWRRPGEKPLSEPMMVILLTHICVTRPQWVKIQVWRIMYWWEWWTDFALRKVLFGALSCSGAIWYQRNLSTYFRVTWPSLDSRIIASVLGMYAWRMSENTSQKW